MTIFLSESLPQQPAFLYATYAPTASVAASSSASGYLAADVLQADESSGWKPSSTAPAALTFDLGALELNDHFAMVGGSFAGVTIALYGSADNVTFGTTLVASTLVTSRGEFWAQYSPATFRYLRIYITGHSTAFQIKHLLFGLLAPLPFQDDGVCLTPVQSEGQHLISYAGLYLGSVTQKITRPFSLNFGQVDAIEEVLFANWKTECVENAKGFFYVPDISQDTCYFGVVDKKWKYEPVMKTGLYTIPKIPFTARVIS